MPQLLAAIPGTRPADFEIGSPAARYELTLWRPVSPQDTGLVMTETRSNIPRDPSYPSTLPLQVEVAAEILTKQTPLDPFFAFAGFLATYEKHKNPDGSEIVSASLTIPHPWLLNKRLGSLAVAPEHKPPVLGIYEKPGKFSPAAFVDVLIDDKNPVDFLLSLDDTNDSGDSIQIHDAAAHVALAQILLEPQTVDSLKQQGQFEKTRGTQIGFLDILDRRLSFVLGQKITAAFVADANGNQEQSASVWAEVGHDLRTLEGMNIGSDEEALGHGLQMREHCVALGEAAKKAIERHNRPLRRLARQALSPWVPGLAI